MGVLKIAKDSFADIEIKPKPPSMEDDIVLETSQILIMVGSAFVSFGVVMLAFFMCRQTLENKKQKSIPFILPDPRVGREPTPIVKDSGLGHAGLGYGGLGYSTLGYGGLGYSGLGYYGKRS